MKEINPSITKDVILPVDYWENEFREGWKNGLYPNPYLLDFLKKYELQIGPKILDVGSGDGRHLLPLARLGYQATGLELTEAGIMASEQKLNSFSAQVKLIKGDFHNIPFVNESFDSVISIQALHYNNWSGACQSFSEIIRVLKTTGLFFFRARSDKGHWRLSDQQIIDKGITRVENRNTGFTVMVHDYTLEELQELAAANKAKIIQAIDDDYSGKPGEWNVIFKKIRK